MPDTSAHEHGGERRSCPVCMVLQVFEELRPEVRAHLAAAGRELVLAVRAALTHDGRPPTVDDVWGEGQRGTSPDVSTDDHRGADGSDQAPTRLRRIAVD